MKHHPPSIAAMLLAAAALAPAHARGPAGHTLDEYQRYQNYPAQAQGTRESRRAERQEARQQLRDPATRGALLADDDEWSLNDNDVSRVPGTHATRKAEREARRADIRSLVRTRTMPVTDEADVSRPAR